MSLLCFMSIIEAILVTVSFIVLLNIAFGGHIKKEGKQ